MKTAKEWKEQWDEVLKSDLDMIGKKALDNMTKIIEEINGWTDKNSDNFIEKVNTKINEAKESLLNHIYNPDVKWLLNFVNMTSEQLDDLIDTSAWTDFTWDYDIDSPDDRESVLSNIFNIWPNVGNINSNDSNNSETWNIMNVSENLETIKRWTHSRSYNETMRRIREGEV